MAKTAIINSQEGVPGRALSFVTRSRDFLKDVRAEMRKVVTPSWKEVQSTTAVVIIATFAFAGFFWAVDAVLGPLQQHLFHWLGALQ
ncbi:MAG TPA: preprotein translocase subunit SecE [Acidobacteriaceae bacterium]